MEETMGPQRVVGESESQALPPIPRSAAVASARTAATAAALTTIALAAVSWVVAVVIVAQKLLPPTTAVDVPIALAILAFGVVILVEPAAVPGLTPM
jgi:hypothetical protein